MPEQRPKPQSAAEAIYGHLRKAPAPRAAPSLEAKDEGLAYPSALTAFGFRLDDEGGGD
jgi:hypothetical protein